MGLELENELYAKDEIKGKITHNLGLNSETKRKEIDKNKIIKSAKIFEVELLRLQDFKKTCTEKAEQFYLNKCAIFDVTCTNSTRTCGVSVTGIENNVSEFFKSLPFKQAITFQRS